MTTFRHIIAGRTHNARHTIAAVVCLVLLIGEMPQGQNDPDPPLTIEAITIKLGNPTDAQGVISAALTRLLRPTGSIFRTKAFFLASQMREEWFPANKEIEFVRLSALEAAALLTACGTYWMVIQADRSYDVASVVFRPQCGAGSRGYRINITGLGYDTMGTEGIGSGYAPSPDCPCLGR